MIKPGKILLKNIPTNFYWLKINNRSNIPINIMFDKKVVRGNTYAASVISKNQDKERMKKD